MVNPKPKIESLGLRVSESADSLPDALSLMVQGASEDPWRGRQIGAWSLQEPLAQGGMGLLYLAKRTEGVATAPCVFKGLASTAPWLQRQLLEREAALLQRLDHPGIVCFQDTGVDPDFGPFLVMTQAPGQSLLHWFRERPGLWFLAEIASWFGLLCEAVAYLHEQKIVHRDIKPANILCAPGEPPSLTLIDFGVALDLRDPPLDAAVSVGSAGYMAPEQIRGELVDTRADIYALGSVLFEWLTRQPLFVHDVTAYVQEGLDQRTARKQAHLHDSVPPLSKARPDLRFPDGLDDLLQSMLAKEPAQRPVSATNCCERFAQIVEGQEIERDTSPQRRAYQIGAPPVGQHWPGEGETPRHGLPAAGDDIPTQPPSFVTPLLQKAKATQTPQQVTYNVDLVNSAEYFATDHDTIEIDEGEVAIKESAWVASASMEAFSSVQKTPRASLPWWFWLIWPLSGALIYLWWVFAG